ncbi:MAG: succinyl-diaminopimelate desuccinylase [Bauldia sp.]|nr:succinyl-diaminopimelate desuccinylase [Bauldia sp.]
MPADPVAIAQDLIRCPSVTPAEGGALAYLERVLSAAGFRVDRPVFSEPGQPDVENLFATIGSGKPHLVFAGHTDVVPPGHAEDWSHPPFAAEIADGWLYGRGAADMKGGIAAFVAAALDRLAANSLPGTLSFLITGDEEGPAVNGTVKLLRWAAERGHRFDACLVGEPTNPATLGDAIKVGRRGSLSATLTVRGRQGHAANPQWADNPVPRMVALLAALDAEMFDEGTADFQPTNLEITSVDVGNPAFNVIPAAATARFNIRFNDRWTGETLTARLRAILDGASPRGAAGYEIVFEPFNSPAFLTDADRLIGPLSDAVAAVTGKVPQRSTSGGTSDARFIKDYCPVVEFGLVGATIHQVDERVSVEDVRMLTRIYRGFINRFFAG